MDAARRSQVVSAGATLIGRLQRAMVDSWGDLLPAASTWSPAAHDRAQMASSAALRGLLTVYEQGDLDDRSWDELRDMVLAQGHATPDEAAELLRVLRIVGVELLAERLKEMVGLNHDERWELQREASAFCAELIGAREELDAASVDAMLSQLERSGPDLR